MLVEPVKIAKVAVATWKESRKTHGPTAPDSGGDHDTLRFSPRPASPTSRSGQMALGLLEHPVSGSNASPVLQLELQHSRSENLTTPHRIPILLPTPYLELPPGTVAETDDPPQPNERKGVRRRNGTITHSSAVQLAALTLFPDHRGTTIPEPAEVRQDTIGPPLRGERKFGLVRRTADGVSTVQKDTASARRNRPPGTTLRFCVFFSFSTTTWWMFRGCDLHWQVHNAHGTLRCS
ncbi:hypothetical protein B0H65DRAFT_202398 [Neurospora tetraspora]|uniref:Uncharacterized protein n=1 Tax=Neurospora tetraspora TaxID=94610 RepID=A0AAE0MT66_9PEZI|nr:hypothetical protein B0H65DRAFT_202398 [Neurospora tetraspora]